MEKIDQDRAWQKDLKKDFKVFRCAIQRNFLLMEQVKNSQGENFLKWIKILICHLNSMK